MEGGNAARADEHSRARDVAPIPVLDHTMGCPQDHLPLMGCCWNYKLEQEAGRSAKSFFTVAFNLVHSLEGVVKKPPSSAHRPLVVSERCPGGFVDCCGRRHLSQVPRIRGQPLGLQGPLTVTSCPHDNSCMSAEMGTCKPLLRVVLLALLVQASQSGDFPTIKSVNRLSRPLCR